MCCRCVTFIRLSVFRFQRCKDDYPVCFTRIVLGVGRSVCVSHSFHVRPIPSCIAQRIHRIMFFWFVRMLFRFAQNGISSASKEKINIHAHALYLCWWYAKQKCLFSSRGRPTIKSGRKRETHNGFLRKFVHKTDVKMMVAMPGRFHLSCALSKTARNFLRIAPRLHALTRRVPSMAQQKCYFTRTAPKNVYNRK